MSASTENGCLSTCIYCSTVYNPQGIPQYVCEQVENTNVSEIIILVLSITGVIILILVAFFCCKCNKLVSRKVFSNNIEGIKPSTPIPEFEDIEINSDNMRNDQFIDISSHYNNDELSLKKIENMPENWINENCSASPLDECLPEIHRMNDPNEISANCDQLRNIKLDKHKFKKVHQEVKKLKEKRRTTFASILTMQMQAQKDYMSPQPAKREKHNEGFTDISKTEVQSDYAKSDGESESQFNSSERKISQFHLEQRVVASIESPKKSLKLRGRVSKKDKANRKEKEFEFNSSIEVKSHCSSLIDNNPSLKGFAFPKINLEKEYDKYRASASICPKVFSDDLGKDSLFVFNNNDANLERGKFDNLHNKESAIVRPSFQYAAYIPIKKDTVNSKESNKSISISEPEVDVVQPIPKLSFRHLVKRNHVTTTERLERKSTVISLKEEKVEATAIREFDKEYTPRSISINQVQSYLQQPIELLDQKRKRMSKIEKFIGSLTTKRFGRSSKENQSVQMSTTIRNLQSSTISNNA